MSRKQTVREFQEAAAEPAVLPPPTPIRDTAPDVRYLPVVAIGELFESPMNPRRHFDAAGLEELTASIREKGVLTPLLARPVPGWNVTPVGKPRRYEIAAGHRRYRAAKAAGLANVPVMAREMTDAELLEVLVVENNQREDVHPLEEAQGFQALLAQPGYDVARLAAKVGRSVKYVYDRVKLLQLTPAAQKLFLEGRFTAGHAIQLARLPAEKQRDLVEFDKDGYREPDLFRAERNLFDVDEDDATDADPYHGMAAVSVRELEAWIDRHVRADSQNVDPVLFPETAALLSEAQAAGEKVIPIMHLEQTPDAARDGQKILTVNAWRRADGSEGSKTCDLSEVGVVEIGPGRYEAFRVCRKKERCKVHWAAEIKAREARQRASEKAAKSGKDPRQAERDTYAEQQRRREQEAARVEAERARWTKAIPAILEPVAAAVKKAPTKASGLLAQIVLRQLLDGYDAARARKAGGDRVPIGRTAEDLLRHAAFLVLAANASSWRGPQDFPKLARAFGIDTKKILDQVAPVEKPTVQTSAKPGKPVRGTCRKCGCQELTPCAGGCGWADGTETRCTACFPPTLKSRAKKKARA